MLKIRMKYSVLAITVLGMSACTTPRTIMIDQRRTRPVQRPMVVAPTPRPVIREEILLGQGSSNRDLGQRVEVPKHTPSVKEHVTTELNVKDNKDENSEPIEPTETKVPRNEVIDRIAFPIEEYKYIKKRGRSTVSGKIYLENSETSEKIRGKKIKLWLNPVTSYSRQWYEKSYLDGYRLSKTDKRLYNYLKFTYSDTSGSFNFFGVPTGEYYLTGSISCSEECGFNEKKSTRLVKEISVGRGVTDVDLTKQVP